MWAKESDSWPKPICDFSCSNYRQLQIPYLTNLIAESCSPCTRVGAQPMHCSFWIGCSQRLSITTTTPKPAMFLCRSIFLIQAPSFRGLFTGVNAEDFLRCLCWDLLIRGEGNFIATYPTNSELCTPTFYTFLPLRPLGPQNCRILLFGANSGVRWPSHLWYYIWPPSRDYSMEKNVIRESLWFLWFSFLLMLLH